MKNLTAIILSGAAVAASISSPASAAPVFLKCTFTDAGGESVFDVQLNEESGTVSYFIHRNGISVKKPAVFTPQKVTLNSFEIDRRNLTFRRDNTRSAFYQPGDTAVDEGMCEIDQTERAF